MLPTSRTPPPPRQNGHQRVPGISSYDGNDRANRGPGPCEAMPPRHRPFFRGAELLGSWLFLNVVAKAPSVYEITPNIALLPSFQDAWLDSSAFPALLYDYADAAMPVSRIVTRIRRYNISYAAPTT